MESAVELKEIKAFHLAEWQRVQENDALGKIPNKYGLIIKQVIKTLTEDLHLILPINAFQEKDVIHIHRKNTSLPRAIEISKEGMVTILLKEKIMDGSIKKVYLAYHLQLNKMIVHSTIDLMPMDQRQQNDLREGLRIQKMFNEKTLLRVYDVAEYFTKMYPKMGIACEYCECGDLYDYLSSSEKNSLSLWNVFEDSLQGLKLLHEKNIFHRDIKPENIFLYFSVEEGEIHAKIADFDFAIALDQENSHVHEGGTVLFLAPERVKLMDVKMICNSTFSSNGSRGEKYTRNMKTALKNAMKEAATVKGDIWSLGITLLLMRDINAQFMKARSEEIVPFLLRVEQKEFDNLLNWERKGMSDAEWKKSFPYLNLQMLQIDPSKRYDANQCLEKVKDLRKTTPFF